MVSKTRAHWPWEDQGTFGCLANPTAWHTHVPLAKTRAVWKIDQKIQGLGEDPSINQSALEKVCLQPFCALGIFLTSGYICENYLVTGCWPEFLELHQGLKVISGFLLPHHYLLTLSPHQSPSHCLLTHPLLLLPLVCYRCAGTYFSS